MTPLAVEPAPIPIAETAGLVLVLSLLLTLGWLRLVFQ